jgi:hypothetical protein
MAGPFALGLAGIDERALRLGIGPGPYIDPGYVSVSGTS